jgi:hypothetical protein
VSIFNLTFLNSYFKFLNNNFSDSATIIFGPFISVIILLIISTMSMFVTAYYVVYNAKWLVLNTASDKYISGDAHVQTHNSHININGIPIFYKPSSNLLVFPWWLWVVWCIIIGYAIAIAIFPLSMGITAYTLLKLLFFILFLPSTCNDEPCNVFTMFLDTFKYKKPLISWIMSLMVISTSFDVFDTTGGIIAIIVFVLVYFNFIKIGLFDKYVPTDAEVKSFVEMPKVDDFVPKCITKYEDFLQPSAAIESTDNATDATATDVDNVATDATATDVDNVDNVATDATATDVDNVATDATATDVDNVDNVVADNAATDADAATATDNLADNVAESATDAVKSATEFATESATDAVKSATESARDAADAAASKALTAAKLSPTVALANGLTNGALENTTNDIEMITLPKNNNTN